ncbi:hypothetical protein DFH08DRAFT_347341 [Mycena albidolilacea]|uniref:Transmembrane protein n=1 Tax=Mycena albidolilacea TaxID=1033008 RepID=A0AAD6ZJ26_9AGAR|nr:hypothetical protein DFH08DRAFT_347341 [Mycena albidolilacea]
MHTSLSPSRLQSLRMSPRTVPFVLPSLFPGIMAGASSSSSKSFAPLPSILFRIIRFIFLSTRYLGPLFPESIAGCSPPWTCQVVRLSPRFHFRADTIITCTFPVCDACGDVGDILNRGRRCLGVPRGLSRPLCPPRMCCLAVWREPSLIFLLCLCSLHISPPPTAFLIFRIVSCPSPYPPYSLPVLFSLFSIALLSRPLILTIRFSGYRSTARAPVFPTSRSSTRPCAPRHPRRFFAHKVPAEVGLLKEVEAFGENEEDGQR